VAIHKHRIRRSSFFFFFFLEQPPLFMFSHTPLTNGQIMGGPWHELRVHNHHFSHLVYVLPQIPIASMPHGNNVGMEGRLVSAGYRPLIIQQINNVSMMIDGYSFILQPPISHP
jgi:hypothetical protein